MQDMNVTKPGNVGHGKGGRPVFTESQEAAIAARVKAGESKQVLADEVGVHRNTIGNICNRVAARRAQRAAA